MSARTDKIKSGYTELSDVEKNEIKEWIKTFDGMAILPKIELTEQLRRISNKSVGPKDSNSCPCCGK